MWHLKIPSASVQTAVRLLADAVIVCTALLTSIFVDFLWLAVVEDRPIPHQALAADLLQDNVHSVWLLILISLGVYAWSGLYSSGRSYRRHHKARVIVRAVTVSYLLFIVLDFIFPEAIQLPPITLLLAWGLTLVLMAVVRLWRAGWAAIRAVELRLYQSEVVERKIKNVLVIGGAGYIGSALLPKLLDNGYHVRLLDLLLFGTEPIADLMSHPELEIAQADFRQVEKVVDAMRDMDAVIHLGAIVGDPACALDEELTIEINLIATRMIAEVAKGNGVQRLIFASTCSVYGASDHLLDEYSALNPVSLYARSKIASEKVLRKMADGSFTPVILRFGTIYGLSGRTRFDLVINVLTAKAVVEGAIPVFGGDQWRPFVHVDDAALAVFKALEAPRTLVYNQVFNVGSDEQNYTIQQIGELVHRAVPTAELISKGADGDRRNYRVSFGKIRTMLGFVPDRTVEEGIQEVIEAIRSGKVQDYRDAKYSNVKFLGDESVARRIPHENGWTAELLSETALIQMGTEQKASTPAEAPRAEIVMAKEIDTPSRLSQIDLERLLRRKPVVMDQTEVAAFVRDKTVMITGAGGSVGSALCRQIARFVPKMMILLDQSANSLSEIELDLRSTFPILYTHPVIADIRDQARINLVVEKYRPDVILHGAAYDCACFMETDVEEAITSNVVGTQILLEAAERLGVNRFVLISCIKAADPANVWGMTRRLGEMLVADAAHRSQRAYSTVRLSHVLDSRSGQISVYLRQIAAGQPLTLTHANMRGYFMTTAEAVQLVLQAAVSGRAGEVLVLDTGEPIRILDLINDLIKISGRELGRDVSINYSGIRSGERLHEELFLEAENLQHSQYPGILVASGGDTSEARTVAKMVNFARRMQIQTARERMRASEYALGSPSTTLTLPTEAMLLEPAYAMPSPMHS